MSWIAAALVTGLCGTATSSRRILFVRALPAALALAAVTLAEG
ncbi:MAG TPA: hypothetical protein VFP72_12605 [Kineosporiaceae bacterium]|nr:hypothetical protein [Kineosporiaceae bacterium]